VVTGAGGFVGRALCRCLAVRGHAVRGLVRRPTPPIADVSLVAAGTLGAATDWSGLLAKADVVIHCAGRAHGRIDAATEAAEPETAAALARQAAAGGLQRLVLVSSLKAMADTTLPGRPLREADPPCPRDAYGRTKYAAERALLAAAGTRLETVIVRPPLVYGPAVKANFDALMRLVAAGLPLPFAGIDNRRSLVFLDNLVDLLALAAVHPAAARRVLLVRDDEDFSTPALIHALARALGCRARLFAVPDPVFALARHLPALGPMVARLTTSLAVDDRASRKALGWAPPVAAQTGLELTARAFRRGRA
jgi:nucleoside-diphosphate-sugar epimerase